MFVFTTALAMVPAILLLFGPRGAAFLPLYLILFWEVNKSLDNSRLVSASHNGPGIIYTHKEVIAETSCGALFYELDRLFSEMIFIHNQNDSRFLEDFDALWNLIDEDFVYTINGHVITGRQPIFDAIVQMFPLYSFRQTLPPTTKLHPRGFFDEHNKLAKLNAVVEHTFKNATGSFQDFNEHFFFCEERHNAWLMLNATLTKYFVLAM